MLHSESSQVWWGFWMASSYAYKQLPEVVYFIRVARVCKIGFRVSSEQMTHRLKMLKLYTISHLKSKYIKPLTGEKWCSACFGIPSQSQKLYLKGGLSAAWQNARVGVHSCRKWFLVLVARVSTHKWLFLFLTSVWARHLATSAFGSWILHTYWFRRVT